MYIDKLDDIVNKYNNTYHSAMKMRLADAKSSTYIYFNEENNKEDQKFEVVDHVQISKYQNIFGNGYVANWSEEVLMIRKLKKKKNTVPWTYVFSDLNSEEIVRLFWEKDLQKRLKKSLQLKK